MVKRVELERSMLLKNHENGLKNPKDHYWQIRVQQSTAKSLRFQGGEFSALSSISFLVDYLNVTMTILGRPSLS